MGKPKITDAICTKPKCGGVLFALTTLSRVEEATGVRRVKCDRCRAEWAFRCDGAKG